MNETEQPRVFVVQHTRHNIVGAAQHGKIVTLLPLEEHISFTPQPVVRQMRELLRDYTPRDMILPVGDPAAIAIAGAIAAERTGGLVTLLKFDKQTSTYYKVELDIFDRLRPAREA